MKIAYIAAGAGGMYCGSCIHDNALATALIARGEETLLLPIYTPMRTDEKSAAEDRVFYGAINVFLEQKMPWFRHLPGFFHHWLDRPGLLRRISASSSATDARTLGALTLSVLQGEEGRQARELEELVEWLRTSFQPDIVHLSNSMLLGLAPRLHRVLGVPVVCSLQGEDIFLEELPPGYKERVLDTMRNLASSVEQFVATTDYYERFMTDYLGLPPGKVSRARIGIQLEGHRSPDEDVPIREEGPLRLGYVARICPEKGLHHLCGAFRKLSEELGAGAVELEVAGYVGGGDRAYLEEQQRRLRDWGLADHVRVHGEVSRREKIEMIQRLDLLSVPTTYHEPKGLFVLEALANGVPVVEPAHGAFPELLERTGGGELFESGSVDDLAATILDLWRRPERRRELSERGRRSVHEEWSAEVMAAETLEIYRRATGGGEPDVASG